MDPILGQIILGAYQFVPEGWALCDGSLLQVNQNQALFSLLGNTFGGDGQTTFALPDLRGRFPVGIGAGPGLTTIGLGQAAGSENVTLTVNNLPPHGHTTVVTLPATAQNGTSQSPANLVPAVSNDPTAGATSNAYGASDNKTQMAPTPPQASSLTGTGIPAQIRNPYLGLQFLISTQGSYPMRP
jgi:microcystin-dependent protein